MPAFPLAKFVYLGIKQLSRPISIQLKAAAKNSRFVSRYICSPPAQALHRLEMFVKFRLMGAKGKVEYSRLSDEKAAEIGSEMLGEAFLYGVATSYMVYEYVRSVNKGKEKDAMTSDNISELQEQVTSINAQLVLVSQSLKNLESVHSKNDSKK